MTITISKDFLLYTLLFMMIVVFGVLYLAQAEHISNQQLTQTTEQTYKNSSHSTKTIVRKNNEQTTKSTVNGNEVIGVVK